MGEENARAFSFPKLGQQERKDAIDECNLSLKFTDNRERSAADCGQTGTPCMVAGRNPFSIM